MWTLWLVSKILQRLSLRSQSSVHSTLAPHISGMKYKYPPMRERSEGEMQGGGYRAVTFFPCRFGEYVTLEHPLSHLPFLKHTLTLAHNQLWKYFSIVKCPRATKATQFSPVGRRSEERSALYLFHWQTSLKSTRCVSPVKAALLHKYKPITPKGKGHQDNRGFLPVQTVVQTLKTSHRHQCCIIFAIQIHSKPKKGKRRSIKVTVQWLGCWKDGEVTGRTFTTLRGRPGQELVWWWWKILCLQRWYFCPTFHF